MCRIVGNDFDNQSFIRNEEAYSDLRESDNSMICCMLLANRQQSKQARLSRLPHLQGSQSGTQMLLWPPRLNMLRLVSLK